jgi:hypothetical protein
MTPVNLTNIVLYQPWDELGVNFFMSNYVGKDPAVSQLHYLPNFYSRAGYATPALRRAIIASGLAGYARTVRRNDLIEASTKTYTAAIRDINVTLSRPEAVIQDTTLMSIMMAAMFETMLVSQDSGMQNVTKHLDGAIAVAHLSLQQQRPSEVFKALLSTLIQSVIMNCWIQHVPLPPKYKQIRPYVPEKINPNSVHAKLVDILSRVIEFRDDLKAGLYLDSESILQKALELDLSLKTFIDEMPSHTSYEKRWIPRMERTEVQRLVYNWVYHGKSLELKTRVLYLTATSLPPAICRPSLEQCPIVPYTPPSAHPPTMFSTNLLAIRKRAYKPTFAEVSVGVVDHLACRRDLCHCTAATIPFRLLEPVRELH